ncbi:MAG: hypothetical protein R3E87_15595 [Burkholderiaceae bacterium]
MSSALSLEPIMSNAITNPHREPAADLQSAAVLAVALEKLDTARQPPDPAQYKLLAERLAAQLRRLAGHPQLATLLARFPAAADVYENLQYEHAGLCLHALEAAMPAEAQARAMFERLRR